MKNFEKELNKILSSNLIATSICKIKEPVKLSMVNMILYRIKNVFWTISSFVDYIKRYNKD